MRLGFVIGSADIGGGANVIFQHALFACEQGWDVTLIHILPLPRSEKPWHRALRALRFISPEQAREEQFDLLLATWWPTVYRLPEIEARQYGYFVQSIESWFVPTDELATRHEIDATYLPPIPIVTEATWIAAYLRKQFGREPHLAPNGMDKDLFKPEGPAFALRTPGRLRVLIEGPLMVDFKNVPRTIELVKRSRPDEIWLLTHDPARWYPGVDRVFTRLPMDQVAEVYRSCDVLVKLSYVEGMFGPPLEMFHCGGTAIVYDVTGHEEYMRHEYNSLIVPTGEEDAVVGALCRLKSDPELLKRLQAGALATAGGWPGWGEASARFLEILKTIPGLPKVCSGKIRDTLAARPVPVTVPDKRPLLHRLRRALKRIRPFDDLFSAWVTPLYCGLVLSRQKERGRRMKVCSLPDDLIARFRGNPIGAKPSPDAPTVSSHRAGRGRRFQATDDCTLAQ